MTLKAAQKKLTEFLRDTLKYDNIEVYYWSYKLPYGLRIAEIGGSATKDDGSMSGWAYMQSEPAAIGILAAAERLVIAYRDDEDVELAEDILRFLLLRPGK
jgi:hypothetical protein